MKVLTVLRLIVTVLSLVTITPLITLAWSNPVGKNENILFFIIIIILVQLCWFATDTLTNKGAGME